jgi:hypothetical protein
MDISDIAKGNGPKICFTAGIYKSPKFIYNIH